MVNTRAITLKLLKKIHTDKSYSNILLDKTLSEIECSPQEKKFISALFYGVIERMITLDAVINKLLYLSQKDCSNSLSLFPIAIIVLHLIVLASICSDRILKLLIYSVNINLVRSTKVGYISILSRT